MYSYSANRTGDQADAASRMQMRLDGLALKATRAQAQGPGRERCQECGDLIDERRRAAVPHAVRCTCCQNIHEQLVKIGWGYASSVPRTQVTPLLQDSTRNESGSPEELVDSDVSALREAEADLGIRQEQSPD